MILYVLFHSIVEGRMTFVCLYVFFRIDVFYKRFWFVLSFVLSFRKTRSGVPFTSVPCVDSQPLVSPPVCLIPIWNPDSNVLPLLGVLRTLSRPTYPRVRRNKEGRLDVRETRRVQVVMEGLYKERYLRISKRIF